MTPTEAQWCWIAGLFEGEGCISFQPVNCVRVHINMTDRDVLETLDRLVPSVGGIQGFPRPPHKTLYRWYLSRAADVRVFLEAVLPHLHARRSAKAEAALERLKNNHGVGGSRAGGGRKRQLRCIHGHPLEGENLYVSPKGWRGCRTCRRRANRKASR